MKMQIDLKSAAVGLVLGAVAMFCMGDAVTGQNPRYQVSAGYGFVAIIDTQTGEVWGQPANTDGEGVERLGRFWNAKNQ